MKKSIGLIRLARIAQDHQRRAGKIEAFVDQGHQFAFNLTDDQIKIFAKKMADWHDLNYALMKAAEKGINVRVVKENKFGVFSNKIVVPYSAKDHRIANYILCNITSAKAKSAFKKG